MKELREIFRSPASCDLTRDFWRVGHRS